MRTSRRGVATSFVVLCMLLGSLSWLSPAAAQETGQPVLSAATATAEATATETTDPPVIDEPVATDEPAATDEPVATDEPATTDEPVATDEAVATATHVPDNLSANDQDELSSAETVDYIEVFLTDCIATATNPAGTFDYIFSGDITATDTNQGCDVPAAGWSVTLTDVTGVNGPYQALFDPSGYAEFAWYDASPVEAGTYTVSIGNGMDTPTGPGGAIVVDAFDFHQLEITHFVAGTVPDESNVTGSGTVSGHLVTCQDPDRAMETDFRIFNAADAGNCLNPQYGQGGFELAGTPNDVGLQFDTVSLNVDNDGDFDFGFLPFGTYMLTDLTTGENSISFEVGGNASSDVYISVVNFYGDAPVLLPVLYVTKVYCGDSNRVNDTEFIFDSESYSVNANALLPSGPTTTCVVDPAGDNEDITLTLASTEAGNDFVETVTIDGYQDGTNFTPLQPGSYTLAESSTDGFEATSQEFTLAYGDFTSVTIVNYVDTVVPAPPGEDYGSVYVDGYLYYCTSPERAGTVDIQLDIAFLATDTGESQCRPATAEEGQVVLYFYGNGTEPTADPVTTFNTTERDTEDLGYYNFGEDDTMVPGWYQLGFRDSAFATQEFRSDIAPLQSYYSPEVNVYNRTWIYAYVDATPATNVYIEKHICYDPTKVSTTDFFINQLPEDAFSAEATTTCRFITYDDEFDYQFTLTNTATDETQEATWAEDPAYGFSFQGVPAGTYTVTETFGAGIYTATSDEFQVDPEAGDPLIVVRNYTATAFDTDREGDVDDFDMSAFTCLNDTFETRYDYYFYPYGFAENLPGGEPEFEPDSNVTGAAAGLTEICQGATTGEYQFQLEPVVSDTGVAATATYILTQDPEQPAQFSYSGNEENPILEGTYVIHELNTGSVSEPIYVANSLVGEVGGDDDNYAAFYFYPAAPTPTATATATPTEPGATATVTPTQGTGWVIPKDDTTATAVPGKDTSDPGTDGGAVTQLPSTGQGGDSGGTASLYLLLGLALSFLLGAAALTRRTRTTR